MGSPFINFDQPGRTRFIASVNKIFTKLGPTGLPMLYYLGYKYWQKSAFTKAKKLHKIEKFDVVHQLTQISFREPGYWWKLGIPFLGADWRNCNYTKRNLINYCQEAVQVIGAVRTFSNILPF